MEVLVLVYFVLFSNCILIGVWPINNQNKTHNLQVLSDIVPSFHFILHLQLPCSHNGLFFLQHVSLSLPQGLCTCHSLSLACFSLCMLHASSLGRMSPPPRGLLCLSSWCLLTSPCFIFFKAGTSYLHVHLFLSALSLQCECHSTGTHLSPGLSVWPLGPYFPQVRINLGCVFLSKDLINNHRGYKC
jgi:hypothetical protein